MLTSELQPGSQLGTYRILRLFGRGGMADVYEADDTKLKRRVALKVLPADLARDAELVSRFEDEVRHAAGLNHRGIVNIFEYGESQGVYYFSMRLLTGGSLRQRIDAGLTARQSLEILREVTEAFSHAHKRGLVHRDVKPENILFDEDGNAVLTDFGIAKAIDSSKRLTRPGTRIGTPRYISPEQARGRNVDPRADLYSLGLILYEMLTGKVPFEAEDDIALIFQHITAPIPRLTQALALYQPLVDSLMAKEPDARPASGLELLVRIDELIGSPRLKTVEIRIPTPESAGALGPPESVSNQRVPALVPLEDQEQQAEHQRLEQEAREAAEDAVRKAAEEAERRHREELARKAAEKAQEAERLRREEAACQAAQARRKADEAAEHGRRQVYRGKYPVSGLRRYAPMAWSILIAALVLAVIGVLIWKFWLSH